MNIKQNRSDAATSKRKEAMIKRLFSLKTRLINTIPQPLHFRKKNVNRDNPQQRQRIKGFIPVSEEFADAAFLYEREARNLGDGTDESTGWVILGEALMRIRRGKINKSFINPYFELAIEREVDLIKSNYDYLPINTCWEDET